jgi:hypothetical protein
MKIITSIASTVLCAALTLATLQPTYAATDFAQTFIIKTLIRFLDTNKNQQIEITEVETRWKQAFDMTDKNANDVLTLDEFESLFKARSTQIKLLDPESKLPPIETAFKALDLNSNKVITHWEFNTHAINQFRLVDTDENDALSQKEMLAVKGRLPF